MTIHLISYTYSGLSLIEEIIPCFSPLKIYIPWGGTIPECTDNKKIIASYPPEKLKPEEDFNLLLNECYGWAYEQGEKSRKEIIKTGHTSPISNESLRHIKTILADRISDTSERDRILKWHTLLHLANRLEEHRNDANRMLEDLKKRPSPLLDNADLTENTRYPLENLRGISPDLLINDTNIKLLFNAWHGLFNSFVDRGDLLLTVDRYIFDYLSEEWGISCNNPGILSFKSPLFKKVEKFSTESIETVNIGNDIQNIVAADMKGEEKKASLEKLTADFEIMFQGKEMDRYIIFFILLFQPPEICEEAEKNPFIKFLSGKALIFAEINARNSEI